jgi:hypothetical protein
MDHVRRLFSGTGRDLDAAKDPVRYGNGMLSRLEDANFDADLAGRRTIQDVRRLAGAGRKAEGFGTAVINTKDTAESRLLDKALMLYRDSKIRPEAVAEFKAWAAKALGGEGSNQDKLAAKEWLPAVERMERLSPEEQRYADETLENAFRETGRTAQLLGVIDSPIENYVRRAWNLKPGQDAKLFSLAGTGLKSFTDASLQRTLPTILDGIMKGYEPRIKGVSQSLENITREIGRIEATKKTVNDLKKIKDEENVPLVTSERREGYVKLDDPNFQAWRWIGQVTSRPDFMSAEPGMEVDSRSRKVFLTPPKDLPGGVKASDVLEKVPLYARADVAEVLNKMTAVDTFSGKIPGLRGLMEANGRLKRTLLSLSLFHHISESSSWMLGVNRRGGETGDWNPITASRRGNVAIDADDPAVRFGVQNGLTLDVHEDWGDLSGKRGWIERGLRATGIGPLADLAAAGVKLREKGEHYLFGQFIPGLKARAFQLEFAQALKKNPGKDMGELAQVVARNINENFGGLNYKRMGRNPTVQNMSRLFLLAPDWTESNFRNFFAAAVPGDHLNKAIDRLLGGIPSPDGVSAQSRGLWTRVLYRTVAATVMANLLLNVWTDKDRDNLVKFYKDQFVSWEQARRLHWTGVLLDPLYRLVGIELGQEHRTLTLPVHYLDPLRLAGAPDLTLKAKVSPIVKWAGNLFTGTDYSDRPFSSAKELATTGKTVKDNRYAEKESFFNRLPATLVNSLVSNTPIMAGDVYKAVTGELDPMTAAGQAAGARVVKVSPPHWKGIFSAEHKGIQDDYLAALKKGPLTDAAKAEFVARVKDYNAKARQAVAENGLTKAQAPLLFNANWASEAVQRAERANRPPEAFKERKLSEDEEIGKSLHPYYDVARAYTAARERYDALREAGQFDAARELRGAVRLPVLEKQVAAVRAVRAEMTEIRRKPLTPFVMERRLALLRARESRLMDRAVEIAGPLAAKVPDVVGDKAPPAAVPARMSAASVDAAEDTSGSRAKQLANAMFDEEDQSAAWRKG